MNTVQFLISKEKETERILWIYANQIFVTRWSDSTVWPGFSGLLNEKLEKGDLDKEARKLFLKEFNEGYSAARYKSVLPKIEKQWRQIEERFFKEISHIPELYVRDKYLCYLTLYGGKGGGSKNNEIYLRVDTENDSDDIDLANHTIAHELIYLITKSPSPEQCLFSLYSQALKERFVQSIIEKPAIKKLLK